jgi:hypothetical protein
LRLAFHPNRVYGEKRRLNHEDVKSAASSILASRRLFP